MSSRTAVILAGGALAVIGAWWLSRRYGLAWTDGILTGVVPLEQVQGVDVLASEASTIRRLITDAQKDGVSLELHSGFRGYSEQVVLWVAWKLGLRADDVATPGHSNHQRAARGAGRGPALDWEVERSTSSPAYQWLARNGPRYGLAPKGTAFGEPWHWELT